MEHGVQVHERAAGRAWVNQESTPGGSLGEFCGVLGGPKKGALGETT